MYAYTPRPEISILSNLSALTNHITIYARTVSLRQATRAELVTLKLHFDEIFRELLRVFWDKGKDLCASIVDITNSACVPHFILMREQLTVNETLATCTGEHASTRIPSVDFINVFRACKRIISHLKSVTIKFDEHFSQLRGYSRTIRSCWLALVCVWRDIFLRQVLRVHAHRMDADTELSKPLLQILTRSPFTALLVQNAYVPNLSVVGSEHILDNGAHDCTSLSELLDKIDAIPVVVTTTALFWRPSDKYCCRASLESLRTSLLVQNRLTKTNTLMLPPELWECIRTMIPIGHKLHWT